MAESRLLIIAPNLGWSGLSEPHLVDLKLVSPEAAELSKASLADLEETARTLPPKSGIRFVVAPHEPNGKTPGGQLARLFEYGFSIGADSICVIGTSVPHLPASYILEAFGRLTQHRDSLVIGPTDAGSCYLIGISGAELPALLKDISWDTANVLTEALRQAATSELSPSLLPSLQTVETVEQGRILSRDLRRGVAAAPQTQYTLRKIGLE